MPHGNVSIESHEIDLVGGRLIDAVTTINPRLLSLRGAVDELLENGLFPSSTSPRIQGPYLDFTRSLTDAMDKIRSFADQFATIASQAIDVDADMARRMDGSH